MSVGTGSARRIRVATAGDAEQILAIYAPIVAETAISFEDEPLSAAEIAMRIASILPTHPFWSARRPGAFWATPMPVLTGRALLIAGMSTRRFMFMRSHAAAASGVICTLRCSGFCDDNDSMPYLRASRSPMTTAWACTRPWVSRLSAFTATWASSWGAGTTLGGGGSGCKRVFRLESPSLSLG